MGGGAGRAGSPPGVPGVVVRSELGGRAGSPDGSAEWAWAPGSGSQFVPTSCSGFCPRSPTRPPPGRRRKPAGQVGNPGWSGAPAPARLQLVPSAENSPGPALPPARPPGRVSISPGLEDLGVERRSCHSSPGL